MQSETVTKIIPAIIKVMSEVESVDKNLDVGTGSGKYKGVADKDVKLAVGRAMQKNGLAIIPTSIEENTEVSSWEETNDYGTKQKQSVFTKVKTSYRLFHTSGEWIDLVGYGHGVDSQDKSAGKATTYALKNALLYTFLVPTGNIDDTDTNHSDELPQKPVYATKTVSKPQTSSELYCEVHKTEMRLNKNGKPFHFVGEEFCNGYGTDTEKAAHRQKQKPVYKKPVENYPDFVDSLTDAEVEEINNEVPF